MSHYKSNATMGNETNCEKTEEYRSNEDSGVDKFEFYTRSKLRVLWREKNNNTSHFHLLLRFIKSTKKIPNDKFTQKKKKKTKICLSISSE